MTKTSVYSLEHTSPYSGPIETNIKVIDFKKIKEDCLFPNNVLICTDHVQPKKSEKAEWQKKM